MPPALTPYEHRQLSQACDVLEASLGADLLAVYLYESALHDGLRPGSDLDLLAIVRAPLSAHARRDVMTALLDLSAPPATHIALRPLEVTLVVHADVQPWRYPPRRELQFGEWLREDLRAGRDEGAIVDPDLALLLTQARTRSLALRGPPARELLPDVPPADRVRALQDTVAQWNEPQDWAGDECTVVLALARIRYTAHTGEMASKAQAAEWWMPQLPPPHAHLLGRAREAYLGGAPDDLAATPTALADFIRYARADIDRVL